MENGRVTTVEVQDRQIAFVIKDGQGQGSIYVTGLMDDPDLVNRLYNAGVKFGRVIPKESSPLLEFFLYWILPLVIFIALGQLLARKMQEKMGGPGGVMSFGKSNARIYVEAETGKTFADVAGQDEAKEALQEVVDFLHNPKNMKKSGLLSPRGSSW